MSVPQAHDYIGLSVEKMSDNNKNVKNFKETELRLGLPGSESPERKCANGVSIFGKDLKDENISGFCHSPLKGFVSGAKRGFSDAINGSGKWGLSIHGGSEVDLVKGDGLFSPRGVSGKNNSGVRSCLAENSVVKEVCNTPTVKAGDEKKSSTAPASKAQVVGWPPIRSFRKNTLATNSSKDADVTGKSGLGCLYVKVSMDGAPYLRKIDLNTYCSYSELSSALEKMFSCFTIGKYDHGVAGQEHLSESRLMDLLHGSEYVLTYEDKDGDWMLVGDVPWEMFTDSCKRLRIMKGSDAIGLAPRTMQKSKSQS